MNEFLGVSSKSQTHTSLRGGGFERMNHRGNSLRLPVKIHLAFVGISENGELTIHHLASLALHDFAVVSRAVIFTKQNTSSLDSLLAWTEGATDAGLLGTRSGLVGTWAGLGGTRTGSVETGLDLRGPRMYGDLGSMET